MRRVGQALEAGPLGERQVRGSAARSRRRSRGSSRSRAGTGRGTGRTPPSGGATAARTDATAVTARPARMTGTLPNRSVRRPEIGDSPNIPNVWPLMTMPTAARSWPCSVMCSGVMVMIRTITTWPVTSATIATGTFGRRRTPRSDVGGRRVPRPGGRGATSRRRARTGPAAGRRTDRIAAAPTKTIGHEVGAGQRRAGRSSSAKAAAGATRFGPMTAPTVAPQTTVPMRRRPPVRPGTGRRPRSATAGSTRCRSR